MNLIDQKLNEIRAFAKANLPKGEYLRISNRCNAVSLAAHKAARIFPEDFENASKARECKRQAIFNAMLNGRHIDLRDSQEFEVSQMHTMMTFIRQDIANRRLPLVLESKWITIGDSRRPIKEYWLETVD